MSEAHDRFYRDMAGLVWLGGEDRLAFLQRMSTNRCADLVPGTGRATVLTDDSGRAVELLACHAGASGAALITTALEATATVAAQLRRYVMYQDRVTVTDASASSSPMMPARSPRTTAAKSSSCAANAATLS